MLQYTVPHCNALQCTAPHCNALHHTATHCNTLQHTTTTHCNILQNTATHCIRQQYTAAQYNESGRLQHNCNTATCSNILQQTTACCHDLSQRHPLSTKSIMSTNVIISTKVLIHLSYRCASIFLSLTFYSTLYCNPNQSTLSLFLSFSLSHAQHTQSTSHTPTFSLTHSLAYTHILTHITCAFLIFE